MDGKQPYRLSRPTERKPAEATHRQELPQQQPVNPQPVQRAPRQAPEKKSRKGLVATLVTLLVVILVVVGGWLGWSKLHNTIPGVDTSKYQAIFLVNGQVYIGKLTSLGDGYVKLTTVYGVQTNSTDATTDSSKQTNTSQGGYKLAPLGSGLLGSEDAMTLSRNQILYYENLKSDSKAVQLIKQNGNSN